MHAARLSSEEFSEAYSGKRTFNRLKENNIVFAEYNLSTVLVDPPRAGLDKDTCKLMQQFQRIVYISCNPETLARDLEVLKESHTIQKVAAFDQFPYTHHLESGVFLVKKEEVGGEVKKEEGEGEQEEGDAKRRKIEIE